MPCSKNSFNNLSLETNSNIDMNTHNHTHRIWRGIPITTVLALSAAIVQAHPGHLLSEASPAHLVTSPDHFLVLVISGVLLIAGARLVQRTWVRRALQCTAAMAFLGAAMIWGSHLM